MSKFDIERIKAIVLEKLSAKFENIKITAVNVAQDRDRDGDRIVHIEVVFEGILKGGDYKQVASAARQLRPALDDIDDDLFPLLSFVSKVDYDRGHSKRDAH